MEESILVLPNVNKGGFQSGFKILNFPFENGSDHSVLVETFDAESLKNSILHHGDPSLEGLRIDDQLLVVLIGLTAEKRFDSLANRSFLGPVEGLFRNSPCRYEWAWARQAEKTCPPWRERLRDRERGEELRFLLRFE